ncbi:SdrD B-like domain-containing protein [Mycetocola saprophilus]|uniref:SdrD B-like domain-containing protein n=1 Tax=Mycetocola saprophilus TaxID=76636 RepID=UPI003BF3633E
MSRRIAALIAGVVSVLLVITGVSMPAFAAGEPVVKLTLPKTGSAGNQNGTPVFEPGKDYTLAFGYSDMADGQVVTVKLPEGVTIPESALVVPAGNTAIKSYTLDGKGNLLVTFADKIPEDRVQGTFQINFQYTEVQTSREVTDTWLVDGKPTTSTVVVKKTGDQFTNIDNSGKKNIGNFSWPGVSINGDGQVVMGPDFLTTSIPYTVVVRSKDARTPLTITDSFSSSLVLVGEPTAKLVTWDAKGMNRTEQPAPSASVTKPTATSFVYTAQAPANSELTLTYNLRIKDAAALESIRTSLQAQYDARDVSENAELKVSLPNTAKITGGTAHESGANVDIKTTIGGIGAFDKWSDIPRDFPVTFKEGTRQLDPTVPVTYTLRADLNQLKSLENTKYKLNQNVVISDDLPAQLRWLSADAAFITASNGTKLTQAVDFTGSATAFAADTYLNQYAVIGNKLLVNVGKSPTLNVEIKVKAELFTLAGNGVNLINKPGWIPTAQELYVGPTNRASFTYSNNADAKPIVRSHEHAFVIEKDREFPLDDADTFTKKNLSGDAQVQPGQPIALTYEFAVKRHAGDARKSKIVDQIDHNVFDVTPETLPAIQRSIEVNREGTRADDSVTAVIAPNGDLEFVASAKLAAAPNADNRAFTLRVTLPVKALVGKDTVAVDNSASYLGSSNQFVYDSSFSSSATSFGDELELTKTLYNPKTDSYTKSLRVEMDADGKMKNDSFIYRVRMVPHGKFDAMVSDIKDVLPKSLEFLGFVKPDQVKNGTTEKVSSDTYRIPGSSIDTKYDAAANTIAITAGALPDGKAVDLFFKVKVKEFTPDIGITNSIGRISATIVPSNAYPLNISKVDSADSEVSITDESARFEVRNEAGEVVVKNVYVVDGKLVTKGDEAHPHRSVTVKEPGTYTVVETRAPKGYLLSSVPVALTIDEDGVQSPGEAKMVNVSAGPMVSVGDYVWLDTNRNGIQDGSETGIAGVKLVVVGPGDAAVTDVYGTPVGPQITDAKGKYSFDNLPTLPAGQHYTVKIVRDDADTISALDGLVPTKAEQGSDRAKDSSTWTATSRDLVNGGERDDTLDFGFVTKSYAIGDYVWIDTNRDGNQDATEPALAGVTVILTDVDGKKIAETTTNEAGKYLFDGLAAGDYKVRFVLTDEQAAIYTFTTQNAEGATGATGSDADAKGWTAQITLNDANTALTTSYADAELSATQGIDPTWDAGVVRKSVSVGDFVWADTNRDGIQDGDEPGIAGVVLKLTDAKGNPVTDVFGNPVAPVTTNAEGKYTFANLPSLPAGESYTVTIVADDPSTVAALKDFVPTKAGAGTDPAKDSSTGSATSGDLVNDGDKDLTLDFGFVRKSVSVGDFVWADTNRDGIQDEGEPGIPGVKLELVGPNGAAVTDIYGNEVAPTVTDENGKYSFENLPALEAGQSYTVKIVRDDEGTLKALAPYVPTLVGAGEDRELDSSEWAATSGDLVTNGAKDLSLDFGFVRKSVSVGDFVWLDINRDGIQDEGEPGIPGVKLELVGPDGKAVTNVFGEAVEPTITDDSGHYSFDNLPALQLGESYTVKIVRDDEGTRAALKHFVPTTPGAGSDRAKDSSSWEAASGDLISNEDHDPTLDFGFVRKSVSVGDVVWVDLNRDGILDKNEPGIPGVKLVLVGPDGEPVTDVFGNPVEPTVTDADGRYSFDNLPALEQGESYTVKIVRDDPATIEALKPYTPTKPGQGDNRNVNSSNWESSSEGLLENGEHDPSLDFGFVSKSYAIGDYVWIDTNANGIQDADEKPLPGANVILTDENGTELARTTTNSAGRYVFDNLPAGSYKVRFELTAEQAKLYHFTTAGADGDNSGRDSDADATTGWTRVIFLGDDNVNLTGDYTAFTLGATEGIDPTWDAGVVLNPAAIVPSAPAEAPKGDRLSSTGVDPNLLWGGGAAALLLLAGGAFMLARARRNDAA